MKGNKKTILLVVALVLVAALLVGVWFATREKSQDGLKNITVQIKYDDVDKSVDVRTAEEYLAGALLETGLVTEYTNEGYFYITGVDGRTADNDKQEWWGISQDGEDTPVGAAEVVLHDGDHYELTLREGWDF